MAVVEEKSRTGRDRQRYDADGRRLVCGGVIVRERGSKDVLLVTSTSKPGRWIVPKGGWEDDETDVEAALREAREEAGIICEIGARIGTFDMESTKPGGAATVWTMFMMHPLQTLETWAEGARREREFVPIAEAKARALPRVATVLASAEAQGLL